jgi:lipopolysaccharide/colanic/teichoic acid biosynthesis glycosyltransferase
MRRETFYHRRGKRLLDLAVALPAVLLAAPALVVAALLVRLRLGSPILFRQARPGRGGEPFTLYKLRTMRDRRDPAGELLGDEARLTPLGRFLRRASLDELPTLWNVVRGEMSLVGPRPLLLEYLPRYSAEQARRHEVPPGITGWAQIHGRNTLTWEEKFSRDIWYVDHVSLGLDLRILGATLLAVFRRDGIHAEGHATMPKFEGSER